MNLKNIKEMSISTLDLDIGTSVAFDHSDSSFFASVDSNYSLSDGSPTQSFTRDINIVQFNAQGEQVTLKNIRTNQDDFSVVISYDGIKAKNYSLSAGQYFDVKIEYTDITANEFKEKIHTIETNLICLFKESKKLEDNIQKELKGLKYGD